MSKPHRSDSWDTAEMVVPPQAGTGAHNEAADWDAVQDVYEQDRVSELLVVGYNRGGLLVQWGSLRGFVPASQLNEFPNLPDGQVRRAELSARVGHMLTLRVIGWCCQNGRPLCSRARAPASWIACGAEMCVKVRSPTFVILACLSTSAGWKG
jgi:small subunit ribosomal protein S1